jgi:hypothetical protein
VLGLAGCIEPYVPAVVDAPTGYLVVDGFINGNGRSTFLLSHTANIAATTLPVEKGAKLFILDNAGGRYPLTEKASGTYQSDSLTLSPARKYQLSILTARNISYRSDLATMKVTPPIDKINWKFADNQVQVSLSTHDPSGQTRYYRWGFIETWEFNSAFRSTLEYDAKKNAIVGRTTPIYTCWATQRSSTIHQGSSAQLSQDALTDVNLFTISSRAERLSVRYSALVSQYGETAEEFAYYDLLRKNTEAVGTVNDPLPSQLTGNVHRTDNNAEPVLGFVGAHTVQQQRFFISRTELPFPFGWRFDTPYLDCNAGDSLTIDYFTSPGNVPISYTPGSMPLYRGSSRECVDCRLRGSNTKPSFW